MIIGIDTGARDYEAAEHVAHTLPGVLGLTEAQLHDVVISTHVARGDVHRDAVAVTLPDGWVASPGPGVQPDAGPEPDAVAGDRAEALARLVLAALPESSAVVSMSGGATDAFAAGPPMGQAGAWAAAVQAATRSAGRLVHYPGRERMTGRFPVSEITVRAAIDEVRLVGSPGPPAPTIEFDSRDYVRPIWQDGRALLLVQPNVGGTVAPFEIEHPPRCCDAH